MASRLHWIVLLATGHAGEDAVPTTFCAVMGFAMVPAPVQTLIAAATGCSAPNATNSAARTIVAIRIKLAAVARAARGIVPVATASAAVPDRSAAVAPVARQAICAAETSACRIGPHQVALARVDPHH